MIVPHTRISSVPHTRRNSSERVQKESVVQPIPWKMRLEMVIGMQIEILNGIKKLPFYGSFQIFK